VFDIGFFELLVVAVVGMLVIGPEQLPSTLRTAGLWWGRAKRAMQATRSEFEQQIGADDLRRQLHNEEVMRRLEKTEKDVQHSLSEQANSIEQALENSKPTSELAAETLSDVKNDSTTTPN